LKKEITSIKRLFVTVIDHTTGPEHQLLFFKKRFLSKDHPERLRMDRFSATLRKLGLREDGIGYGPSKEKWERLSYLGNDGFARPFDNDQDHRQPLP
jgi:hypothetical protein